MIGPRDLPHERIRGRRVSFERTASLEICAQDIGDQAMSDAQTTTDHEAIRKWADERGGRPATVKATEEDGHAGILRIDFGPKEKSLDPIDWKEFFRKFDESKLAFLYQDRTKDGQLSRFHKFIQRSGS
jgi:hypothetical protein